MITWDLAAGIALHLSFSGMQASQAVYREDGDASRYESSVADEMLSDIAWSGGATLFPVGVDPAAIQVFGNPFTAVIRWRIGSRDYALYTTSSYHGIEKPAEAPGVDADYLFSGSEDDFSVSFEEKRTGAYALTQYCNGGASADPDCHDEAALLAVVDTLKLVSTKLRMPPPEAFQGPVRGIFLLDTLPELPPFWFSSIGELPPGTSTTRGEEGVRKTFPLVQEIAFPLERGPGFINSQIFGAGGGGYANGRWPAPGGMENDPKNFQYPWQDNFCEVRLDKKHASPMCPGGRGHKGVDLRAATCENGVHWLVSPEDGWIINVGSVSVHIMGKKSGLIYKFSHVSEELPDWVETGAEIKRGQRFALMSNRLTASSRATTVHAHIEIHGGAVIDDSYYVGALPPYSTFVVAYFDMIEKNPEQAAPVPQPPIAACRNPQ